MGCRQIAALNDGEVVDMSSSRVPAIPSDLCDDLRYWAPAGRGDTEVDFLLSIGDRVVAIEAKSGASFRSGWCKGLRAIQDLNGLTRRIVVTPSSPSLVTEDGIEVWPFSRLVETVRQGVLFG